VIAPIDAVLTSRMYFASSPRVYFGFGAFHFFRRAAISFAGTFSCSRSFFASMVI